MKKTMVTVFAVLGVALCALVFSCATTGGAAGGTAATWDWLVNGDQDNKGTSTIQMAEYKEGGHPAYKFTGNITNAYEYGFVNVKCMPDTDTLANLQKAQAISFQVRGDGEKYAVKITTSDISDYCYYEFAFDTVEGAATTVVVPIDYFFQPPWGKPVGSRIDTSKAMFIEYQTTRNGSPGPFEFALWNLQVWTDKVPTEKQAGGSGKPPKAAAAAKGIGGDLGALELVLNDNFQYGDGYQGILGDKRLFNGHKIVPGEKYTLKITYTTSRDLESELNIGLVDTTPQANYWRSLSWEGDEGMAEVPKSKAGEKVSVTIQFTTVNTATGTSGVANALVFTTKGEGKKGTPQSGVKKAVKLNFSEFVFLEGHHD